MGNPSQVVTLPPGVAGVHYNGFIPSFAISPDSQFALYTQLDHSEHDIVMVENFRGE